MTTTTAATTGKRQRHTTTNNATNKNPLAKARGKQESQENIWFKRTGAAKHLFVQYYHGQPSGTVCSSASSGDGEQVTAVAASASSTVH